MWRFDWQVFWPRIIPLNSDGAARNTELINSLENAVNKGCWSRQSEIALEEVRRMFDTEQERRKSADSKAGIYLAAVTALIPVLVSLLPYLWGEKINKALGGISLIVFAIAVAYVLRAGYSAFCVLRVSAANHIDTVDITKCWSGSNPTANLAKRIAIITIKNFKGTNTKVTYIKQTHQYLLRAFFAFTILLAVQAIWPSAAWLIDVVGQLIAPEISRPLIMCFS